MAMPASNVVLRGTFNANTSTPYTVEHYFEDLDSDDKDDPDTLKAAENTIFMSAGRLPGN